MAEGRAQGGRRKRERGVAEGGAQGGRRKRQEATLPLQNPSPEPYGQERVESIVPETPIPFLGQGTILFSLDPFLILCRDPAYGTVEGHVPRTDGRNEEKGKGAMRERRKEEKRGEEEREKEIWAHLRGPAQLGFMATESSARRRTQLCCGGIRRGEEGGVCCDIKGGGRELGAAAHATLRRGKGEGGKGV